MKLINNGKPLMKFRVVDNLDEEVMTQFISWVRFVTYKGDLAFLYLAKNEAINEYQAKRKAQRN